jgi:hypothetical protein
VGSIHSETWLKKGELRVNPQIEMADGNILNLRQLFEAFNRLKTVDFKAILLKSIALNAYEIDRISMARCASLQRDSMA